MNTIKIALTGAVAVGLTLVGTPASAEAIRSASAFPGVVSVKKIMTKVKRTAAPGAGELNAAATPTYIYFLSAAAAVAAGYTVYEVVDGGNGGVRVVSPGT
jgi:hypothetical protein